MIRKLPKLIILLIVLTSIYLVFFKDDKSTIATGGVISSFENVKGATLPKINSFNGEKFTSTFASIQSGVENKKQTEYNRKIAYVTFDDGPNEYTSSILNTLKEKNAKATFFWIEPNIKKLPEISKQVVEEGHYPAIHSVTHKKERLYRGNPNVFIEEMLQTQKTIKEVTNFHSILIRTPYGSKPYTDETRRNKLVDNHLKMWDWSVDSYDWSYGLNVEKTLAEVKKQVTKDIEVILFHDREGTASILPKIIDYLKTEGYSVEAYNPDEHYVKNFWKDERL